MYNIFPVRKLCRDFFPNYWQPKTNQEMQLLGYQKKNTGQWKMVSFLGLRNTCMINQCTPDYTKSEKIKVYSQNVFTWKVSRVANISCKLVVNDITKPVPQVANTSSIIVIKGIRKTHKQKAELFSKVFTLLFHCV